MSIRATGRHWVSRVGEWVDESVRVQEGRRLSQQGGGGEE